MLPALSFLSVALRFSGMPDKSALFCQPFHVSILHNTCSKYASLFSDSKLSENLRIQTSFLLKYQKFSFFLPSAKLYCFVAHKRDIHSIGRNMNISQSSFFSPFIYQIYQKFCDLYILQLVPFLVLL